MAKFQVMMKSPDAVGDAYTEAAKAEVAKIEGIDEEERELLFDERYSKIKEACSKWFEYDEYLQVEVDTDAGTCTVVEC